MRSRREEDHRGNDRREEKSKRNENTTDGRNDIVTLLNKSRGIVVRTFIRVRRDGNSTTAERTNAKQRADEGEGDDC